MARLSPAQKRLARRQAEAPARDATEARRAAIKSGAVALEAIRDAAAEAARPPLFPTRAQQKFSAGMALAVAGAMAAAPNEAPALGSGAEANAYELQRARLGVDLRRLREIQSVERKIELKHELLPGYADWVAGIMAANSGAEDDVLSQVMIWRIDVGDYEGAFPLAEYMLRHKLALPERFKRTLGTFIIEDIAEAAAKARGQCQDFDLDQLLFVEALCADEDMPDIVQAKLNKEIGLLIVRGAEAMDPDADGPAGQRKALLASGLDRLRRAYGLSHTVGVKKDIDRLERELSKLATEAAAAELTAAGGS